MHRMRGDTARRTIGAKSYGRILAESGPSRIEPIIPWEEPEHDLSMNDVPPEMRGDVWKHLSFSDRVALVAISKGWRSRRTAELLRLNPSLRSIAERGAFDTLEALEEALRRERVRVDNVA